MPKKKEQERMPNDREREKSVAGVLLVSNQKKNTETTKPQQ